MTKVKCILGYYDTQFNRSVAIGEEFEVADDRAKKLVKAKVVVMPPTSDTEPAPAKPKKARVKKEA